jgi:hypothetical protein
MKIILTENQIKRLTNKLKPKKTIIEGTTRSEKFNDEVVVNVITHGVKLNENEVDWASCEKIKITYDIGVEYTSWGIKGIGVSNIKGPSEFKVEITPEEVDDQVENVTLVLPYDWGNVQIKEEREQRIGVDTEITLKLKNTEDGQIIIDYVSVTVFTL